MGNRVSLLKRTLDVCEIGQMSYICNIWISVFECVCTVFEKCFQSVVTAVGVLRKTRAVDGCTFECKPIAC